MATPLTLPHSLTMAANLIETPLAKYIFNHRADDTKNTAFTGLATIKGKFSVSDEEYPDFLDLLHEHLFVQHRRPLNLVEQRRCDLENPILIDLDFKYPAERALERLFDLSHIHAFVRRYVENLTHFYDMEEFRPLRFFITLRPAPYEDKKANALQRSIKDGVHIECPDLVLSSEHQQVLRHRSLELNDLGNAFKGTGYINEEKDIFDEAIVKKNGWFFYGESKPDIPAYQLASVYIYDPQNGQFYEEKKEVYSSRQLLELLSIRYNLRKDDTPAVKESASDEWKTRLDYCTGRRFVTACSAAAANDDDDGDEKTNVVIQVISTNSSEQLEQEKLTEVRRLVMECVSANRAGPYKEWIEMGWCLHNINSSEEMFNLWMDFSRRSPKFSEADVGQHRREWIKWSRSSHSHPITERSLHAWAKADNPRRYREIMTSSFTDFVEREVDATHTHIARLMKKMYKNEYCAAVDSKKVEWYQFTGIYWKKLPQGIELRNKINTEVANIMSETKRKLREQLTADHNGEDKLQAWKEKRLKDLHKIEGSLYQSGFKDSVMKDCIGLFYEEDFAQKLNSNQYLLGFKNGVVDLRHPYTDAQGKTQYTVVFRKAEPTDFITFQAGRYLTKDCDGMDYIEYDPRDPEQAPIHAEIDDFMAKIFPRPELRAYMWRRLASCLEGANKEQTYETWIGVGGNGKSKLVDLMSMTLGDYVSSLQSTAMTRKRPESGAANPDIMAIRNKRFIFMAEPDDREPLNTSRMKQFSGEDDVEARGLFEDQTKFKITGKIFMLCNNFPAINTMDRGTWRRVRAVPFESKFVDPNVEEPNPALHIYPRDDQLDHKMRTWRMYFMSRLVHIYKTEYMVSGLGKVPAIVTQESQKYQETFDSVAKFMNARIREVKKGGHTADIRDIFRVYKYWYDAVGGGVGRKLNQQELYKRLAEKCGEPADKKTFKQMRLFEEDADIEEYDRNGEEDA